jgi:23S rRNA (cytidine1920-2'-O)/16S rRNA (cytidine1409-2'-O)-methyltransferase
MAGLVLVGRPGEPASAQRVVKPGARVAPDAVVTLREGDHPYVGRGGVKLAAALDAFGIDARGRVALDIGASTGGFTDCLLRRGAARVMAVDVGYGQLAWSLRHDPRVTVIERTNVRYLDAGVLPACADLVVIDVSFISLRLVLPAVRQLCHPGAAVVALVKPQFEVGKGCVGKGGVVRDARLREETIDGVAAAAETLGYVVKGRVDSPLPGPRGNLETFLHLGRL